MHAHEKNTLLAWRCWLFVARIYRTYAHNCCVCSPLGLWVGFPAAANFGALRVCSTAGGCCCRGSMRVLSGAIFWSPPPPPPCAIIKTGARAIAICCSCAAAGRERLSICCCSVLKPTYLGSSNESGRRKMIKWNRSRWPGDQGCEIGSCCCVRRELCWLCY